MTDIINVAINLIAALMVLCTLVLFLKNNPRDYKAASAYFFLVLAALVMGIVGVAIEFVEGPANSGPYALAVFLEFIYEACIDLTLAIWFLYSSFKTYDSIDYIKRKLLRYSAPIAIIFLLEVVNLFTGIFWYYDSNVVYHSTDLYDYWDMVRYIYLIMSIYQFRKYKKENGKQQFFTIWIYVIPVAFGTIAESLTGHTFFTLGVAVSTALLYMLFRKKENYTDDESGFYNLQYLGRLENQVNKGEREPRIAIRLSLLQNKDVDEFYNQLKTILPEGCDTVRTDDNTFITLVYSDARGLANLLTEDIHMIAESQKIPVEVETFTKDRNESSIDFLTGLKQK